MRGGPLLDDQKVPFSVIKVWGRIPKVVPFSTVKWVPFQLSDFMLKWPSGSLFVYQMGPFSGSSALFVKSEEPAVSIMELDI